MNVLRITSHGIVVAAALFVGHASAMNFDVQRNVKGCLNHKDMKSVVEGMAVNVGGSILKEEYDKGNPVAVALVRGAITGLLVGVVTGDQDAGIAAGLTTAAVTGATHVVPQITPEMIANPVNKVVPDCVKTDNAKMVATALIAAGAAYYAKK